MTEQILKEETIASNFFMNNMDKFLSKSGVSAVLRKKLEETHIDNDKYYKLLKEAEQRVKLKRIEAEQKQQTKSTLISTEQLSKKLDMRSASPKTKALLYEGTSYEGKGRKQYLDKRYHKAPEDKFPYPLPISWDYGWRLSDWIGKDSFKKSPHGRVCIVNNTFYNRTGIQFGSKTEPKPWYA
ncbi:unnamed protein product [Heterobilharzia americana]|nr:unnamed protein product [Heterobilharzia americana]